MASSLIHNPNTSATTLMADNGRRQSKNNYDEMASGGALSKSISSQDRASLKVSNEAGIWRSSSMPNISIKAVKGARALWDSSPTEMNHVRERFIRYHSDRIQKISQVPDGESKSLSSGMSLDPVKLTQPTMRSCSFTAFISSINDHLKSIYPDMTTKDMFKLMIERLVPEYKDRLFKRGMNLAEACEAIKKICNMLNIEMEPTAYPGSSFTLEQFKSALNNLSDGERCVINFGASKLYGLKGKNGHFAHADKLIMDDNDQPNYIHLIEPGSCYYPKSPYVPVADMLDAIQINGTDGNERGIIILRPMLKPLDLGQELV